MTPLLINVNEAAALLGVARRTVYELRARPDFPKPIALARRAVRYRVADLEAWIATQAGIVNAPEPATLKAGKAAKRAPAGGRSAGAMTPDPASPRRAPARSERPGFEPAAGANSNPQPGARK